MKILSQRFMSLIFRLDGTVIRSYGEVGLILRRCICVRSHTHGPLVPVVGPLNVL